MTARSDRMLTPTAMGAGVLAFILFAATAAHDIAGGAGIDSAKFGYMGRILGVPHAPGYPLYMLVGWVFSWLPVGSLMFRLSLLSALGGALTVALLAGIGERLRCTPAVAALVALIAGTGRVYWSQATVPEVYTLHSTLLLGTLAGLLAWSETGRTRALYVASLCFGLDLAHHTDIAVFAPAILIFILVSRPAVLGSIQTVATALAIALAPLSLYGYVIVRTRQGAPYVEVPATNLSELIGVISGREFGYLLFRGSAWQALHDRWRVIGGFIVEELGVVGCVLALVGLAALWRRNRAALGLITIGAAGVLFFVFNYYPPDIEVFLIPAFLLAWIATTVAADAIANVRGIRVWMVPAALVTWLACQGGANLSADDAHAPSFEARLFSRVFDGMPAGAAILGDTIDVSHMVLYKIFSDPAVAARAPTLVVPGEFGATRVFGFVRSTPDHPVVDGSSPAALDRLVRERPAVYVFARMAEALNTEGFRLDPLRFPDGPLADYVKSIERGHVVIVAGPAAAGRVMAGASRTFASIGAADGALRDGQCYAIVGVAGAARGAAVSTGAVGHIEIHKGEKIGATSYSSPEEIGVECGANSAVVRLNGHDVSVSETGAPVVVLDERGTPVTQTMAAPRLDYQVPFEWTWQPTYRIGAPRRCAPIGPTATDITGPAAESGLAIAVPPGAHIHLDLGADTLVRPRASHFNKSTVPFAVADSTTPAGVPANRAARWVRVDIGPSTSEKTEMVDLVLGTTVRAGVASIDRSSADRGADASVCALTLGNFALFAGTLDGLERVMADESREELFADGWYPIEQDEAGGFRWTSAIDAHVLAPMVAVAGPVKVSLRARFGPNVDASDAISIVANGRMLPVQTAVSGWGTYSWLVDGGAWREGLNDIAVHVARLTRASASGPDQRALGVAVRELDFQLTK